MDSSRTTSTERGTWSSTDEADQTGPPAELTGVVTARIGAQIVDLGALALQFFAVYVALGAVFGPNSGHDLLLYSALTLPLYGGLLEGFWNGQTIGKRMLDIQVVDGDGSHPTFARALVRNLPAVLLFGFGISAPIILASIVAPSILALAVIVLNEKRQRVFDRIAGTYVVAVGGTNDDSEPKQFGWAPSGAKYHGSA